MEPDLPLSAAQLGIWYAIKAGAPASAYSIAEYTRILGSVDKALFEAALRQLVGEVEALRLRFFESEGVVSQRVAEAHEWRFSYWDFTKEADPLRAAESWMRADAAQPMSVEQWPLFGFALFKLCANEFLWFFRSHHLIMDGYSGQVVTQRLAEIYSSLSQGRIGGVQQLGSLRDVIDEDVAYRRSPSFESDRKFWLDALNECPESPFYRRVRRRCPPKYCIEPST